MILFFAYLCENHPLYPHDEKVYDRDHFFFLVALLFLFGFYTLHKNGRDTSQRLDGTHTGTVIAASARESISLSRNTARDVAEQDISKKSTSSTCDSLSIVQDCHPKLVEEGSSSSSLYKRSQISAAYATRVKEAKPYNDVLNRDQTEEWKGW